MSLFNKIAPTSASIQKEYLNKRKRALYGNDTAKTERVKAAILRLHQTYNLGPNVDWHDTYLNIHGKLQRAELTINLEASSWFLDENNHGTYASMYERGLGADGKMTLTTDAQAKMPASARAVIDDLVTLPDEWANAHPFSQRKRLYNALTATGARNTRETQQSLADPKPQHRPLMPGSKTAGFTTTNTSFKAKAKQVFAALNYGGRPHGSCTFYGHSYIVLKPALKRSALYYAGDTFFSAGRGAAQQATFETIGALIEHADRLLARALWDSLMLGNRQADTHLGEYLIEAHIFKKLKVAEDVQSLVLSRQRSDSKPPLTNSEWDTIRINADKWCARNGVNQMIKP